MANLFESNWSATKDALLEGLSGNRKSSLDVVLENTKRHLSEAATAGATGAGSVATLNKVMLPLIRRVMPSVIANELVGVQPMSGPVGQIHTLRTRYAESATGVNPGDEALSPFKIANAYSGSPDATAASEGTAGKKMSIQILKQTVEAKTNPLDSIAATLSKSIFFAISIILLFVNLNASGFFIKVVMSLNKIPFLG